MYRVLSPDICQDWSLPVNCSQYLLIVLCTSGKGYHMMATIKMPQLGRDCYCCNSQGILFFAIHGLFNFEIFFVNILSVLANVCPPRVLFVHHLLLMSIKQPFSLSHRQTVSSLCPSMHWEKIKLGVNLASGGLGYLL